MEARADIAEQMLAIMASFPTLRGVFDAWDPIALDRWACDPETGASARHAARFVLSLWNAERRWLSGNFELHLALLAWDEEHRAAFATWARTPSWP